MVMEGSHVLRRHAGGVRGVVFWAMEEAQKNFQKKIQETRLAVKAFASTAKFRTTREGILPFFCLLLFGKGCYFIKFSIYPGKTFKAEQPV
jgi:hypothetical protein